MLNKWLLVCLIACSLPAALLSSHPQAYADSLTALLPETRGEDRFGLLHRLAETYQRIDISTAEQYADSAISLAIQIGRPQLVAMAYNTKGKLYHLLGQYVLAARSFQLGLDQAQDSQDEKLELLLTNGLGISYLMAGDYESAFAKFNIAIEGFRDAGQLPQVASTLVNIGAMYSLQENPGKAIACYEEALTLARNISHRELELKALSALGKLYGETGAYEQAVAHQEAALAIGLDRNYPALVISCHAFLGEIYQKMEEFSLAESHFREGLELAEAKQIPIWIQAITHRLGKLAWARGNTWAALPILEDAERQAERLQNRVVLAEVSRDLSSLHQEMGNFVKALNYYQRFHELELEKQLELNEKQLQEIEVAFRLEQQERTILDLQQQQNLERYRMMGLLVLALLILAGFVALLMRFRERKRSMNLLARQHEKIRAQNDLLRSQKDKIEEQHGTLALQKQEIEERNQLLVLANSELRHFADRASHDLREPLRTIRGYMSLLEQQYRERLDDRATNFLEMASQGAVRMSDLLKALNTYSAIGRTEADFHLVDLNRIAQEAIQDLQGAISERQAVVTVEALPVLHGIREDLYLLIQNLLSNALKFTPLGEAPQVQISAEEEPESWLLMVRDRGIGIDPEQHDQVFQIFQRLHSRDRYDGSGIGLATCKKVAEGHGGSIWFESAPGDGTTFFVRLPK